MQEMTSTICAGAPEGYERQLKDTRDNQLYYIGKMKDGKCWMLQNLALGNTGTATVLNASNSNITSDWGLPKQLTSAASGSTSSRAVQSWNFGKWVLATPLLTTSCGTSGITSLANCTKVGFVDVSSSSKFQGTYTATTGTWNGANAASSTLVAVNCTAWSGENTSKTCTAGTYDPHYLVGNYYSWNAATAETGVGLISGQARASICPKGWRLPTGKASGEFVGLVTAYGVNSSLSGTVDEIDYNIAGNPLWFNRGGFVDPGSSVIYAGSNGSYWSSTPNSDNSYAYRLDFNNSSVSPSGNSSRYYGFSVRCVAE